MKKTYNTYCLLAVALIMLLTACVREEAAICQKQDNGLIIMSLSDAKTRAGELFVGDARVAKARIFVFIGDFLEKNELFTSGDAAFNNPFIMTVTTGHKDVYVVTNETGSLAASLPTVTTKGQLKALLADEISSPLTSPFVMTGEVLNVEVVETPDATQNKANITLKRVAAKISLTFKKDTEATVQITKVSLLNNTGKTPLHEGAFAVSGQTYWNWVHALPTALNLSETATAISGQDSIYVYENLAGETDKTHAILLEVEALYDNIPTKYRVYLNENIASPGSGTPGEPGSSVTTPDDHLYKIKRNHHYQFTGTIKGMGEFNGLEIIYQIVPWELVSTALFMDYGYRVEVDENGKVTVKNTMQACNPHSVKLKAIDPFKFDDDATEKEFSSLAENESASYTITPVPTAGAGAYLEVWYNDEQVKTFTK